jgi:predicted oxidoreductase
MSKKFTLPEPSEAAILDAIRRGLRIHPKVAWFERMNSGAHVAGEGPAKRFIRFGFVGCPDIIQRAVEHGGVAFVARSVADVFDVLDRCC